MDNKTYEALKRIMQRSHPGFMWSDASDTHREDWLLVREWIMEGSKESPHPPYYCDRFGCGTLVEADGETCQYH